METDNLSETEMAATTSRRTINETFDFDADEQHPDTQTESEDDDGVSDDEEEGYALNSKQRAAANSNPTVAAAAKTGSIKIFVRVRPPRTNDPKLHNTPGRYYCVNPNQSNEKDNSDADNQPKIGFRIPKDSEQGLINNQRENYDYKFNRVFDTDTTQDEVFDFVAKDVVLSAMEGYNGTIFAYGQTGSGKTFTITGGAERYSDRGLIPRTLQFIYKEAKARVGFQYEIGISYLEIYNEMGYDLLDSTRDAKKLEDLPRVRLQEGENQQIHVQNLSSVTVNNEEEALNLLFVGDTNRMIAETPSNPASSRSHCLFIITIRCKKDGDDRMWKSKLHLVDLAGSERTSRTGIGGNLFKEATYINLSLHYLEQVIVALHEKHQGKRTHIPYRNSMMTSILRDSLGGNCMTTMIATCAPEDELIEESISTCRFAQRVALISNRAMLNEELDPKLVIARLKREIVRLKAELAIARGETESESGELPDYERDRVKVAVEDYLSDTSSDAALVFSDARKIAEAFRVMKDKIIHLPNLEVQAKPAVESAKETDHQPQRQEMAKLQSLLGHRDNEINVLIGMINKYKTQLGESRLLERKSLPLNTALVTDSKAHAFTSKTQPQLNTAHLPNISFSSSAASLPIASSIPSAAPTPNLAASMPRFTTDMAKLFEAFKAEYPGSQWIEDQKAALKTKYTEAKKLGELANSLRIGIKHIKDKLAEPDTGDPEITRAKQELRESITNKVSEYKAAYQSLKDMKLEIDHMEHLLEQARLRLSRAFEQWHDEVHVPTSSLARSSPFSQQLQAEETQPTMDHTLQNAHLTLFQKAEPLQQIQNRVNTTNNDTSAPPFSVANANSTYSSTSTLFLSDQPNPPFGDPRNLVQAQQHVFNSRSADTNAWNEPSLKNTQQLPLQQNYQQNHVVLQEQQKRTFQSRGLAQKYTPPPPLAPLSAMSVYSSQTSSSSIPTRPSSSHDTRASLSLATDRGSMGKAYSSSLQESSRDGLTRLEAGLSSAGVVRTIGVSTPARLMRSTSSLGGTTAGGDTSRGGGADTSVEGDVAAFYSARQKLGSLASKQQNPPGAFPSTTPAFIGRLLK